MKEKKINMTQDNLKMLYRDWGIYYAYRNLYTKAINSFDKSLEIEENSVPNLYSRSCAKTEHALNIEALKDALKAYELNNKNHRVILQSCDCYFDLNEFEKFANMLGMEKWKFRGVKRLPFDYRLDIFYENYENILGKNAGDCLFSLRDIITIVHKNLLKNREKSTKPMWKELKENNECDVISIKTIQEKILHIKELKRVEQLYRKITQIYFQNGWIDYQFLKDLIKYNKTNSVYLKPLKKNSIELLQSMIDYYTKLYEWLKMLQARCPLYTKYYQMYKNEHMAKQYNDRKMFYIQYQTRRDMFNQLAFIKKLRKKGNIKKLMSYVEQVMGEYYEIKTLRVMPRKFEFTNEIYNIVALAHCDQLKIPSNLYVTIRQEKILCLFDIKVDKEKFDLKKSKFGDKSTYKAPDEVDYSFIECKKITTTLEKRIPYAKYPIEFCYLYHEIAKQNLIQSKFKEGHVLAERIINEATKCGNAVWLFLGYLMICKADAIQHNVEKVSENLSIIKERVLPLLKNKKISNYIDVAITLNNDDINDKIKSMNQLLSEWDN